MGSAIAESPRTHFVLLPLIAQGHLIPMTDFAILLAQQGHPVSILTTPYNATRLQLTLDSAGHSGLPINLVRISIPTDEVGLPPGCENFDLLPTGDAGIKLFMAARYMEKPLKEYIQSLKPTPTCLVSDFSFWWTHHVSRELKIPRYVFYSVCCFTLFCFSILPRYYESEGIEMGDPNPFAIPGIPHHVVVTREQAPGWSPTPEMTEEMKEGDDTADGFVVNTFSEMESMYVERYAKEMRKPVWTVGPLALCNKAPNVRGGRAAVQEEMISSWLDTREERSVVYVSLGTLSRISLSQLKEIGLGLEATGRPFVWVIRSDEELPHVEGWLKEEGLEERTKGRGLIIRGWAPQLVILSHASVGAFVTHCGWNSVMEGVTAGVPFVTWPQFMDQFLNERFLVDVVRTGVAVGVQAPSLWWMYNAGKLVRREAVAAAVEGVMGEGKEGEGIRRRAEELGVKARNAVGEGGSSHSKVTAFIEGRVPQLADP